MKYTCSVSNRLKNLSPQFNVWQAKQWTKLWQIEQNYYSKQHVRFCRNIGTREIGEKEHHISIFRWFYRSYFRIIENRSANWFSEDQFRHIPILISVSCFTRLRPSVPWNHYFCTQRLNRFSGKNRILIDQWNNGELD